MAKITIQTISDVEDAIISSRRNLEDLEMHERGIYSTDNGSDALSILEGINVEEIGGSSVDSNDIDDLIHTLDDALYSHNAVVEALEYSLNELRELRSALSDAEDQAAMNNEFSVDDKIIRDGIEYIVLAVREGMNNQWIWVTLENAPFAEMPITMSADECELSD